MGIFRTNDPTQFDDIDGIIVDETAPPANITGVAANIAILVGQFQRGPKELSLPIGSIGEFHEIYGKSAFSGNKQLKNKKFGRLKIIRAVAAGAAKASYTADDGSGAVAEVFTVTTVADVSSSLNNKYFLFETITALGVRTSRYIWFNVGGAGVDPALAGKTGHVVAFAADATADQVAAAIQLVLTAVPDMGATVLSNVVTATSDNPGNLVAAAAGNSGFTVATTVAGNGADRITFTAKYEGDYGNNLKVTIAAGSNVGRKYTFEDTNTDAVLPKEVYDDVEIAAIVASTFSQSRLMDVTVVSSAAEPEVVAATNLAGGSEGSIADTDYQTAIDLAGVEKAGNVLFLDIYNATRNGYLKVHAATYTNKMVIVCGAEGDSKATAITDVANYRDSEGRIIYGWPYVQTSIDGVLEFTPPASWIASVFSQVAPHIALSWTANTQYLAGVTALKTYESRAGYISLDEAGICALERDLDIGFLIKNAIVTQIANSSKRTILRRRMADFLTDSIALFLKNYQNDVNSAAKRTEVKGAILNFDSLLVQSKVLPGEQDVKDGAPLLVDTESLNTDNVIASGMFKILYKRRIFSSMRYIVLTAEIGESVVVTEAAQ